MYFLTANRMIRSARILLNEKPDIAPTLRIGEITDLFPHTSPHINFDLYPDGEHFLMLTSVTSEGEERTEIRVTLNFFEELKQLAPTGKD